MVIVEQVIRDLLIQTNLCDTRVFLRRAPQVPAEQQKNPFMIFSHVAPLPVGAHDGPLDLMQRDYQVQIFDPSQSKAIAIGDSLRAALDGYRQEFEGVRFGAIFYRAETSAYESETRLHEVMQEYRFLYQLIDPQPAVRTRSNNRNTKE
jgi:hypothetical protein